MKSKVNLKNKRLHIRLSELEWIKLEFLSEQLNQDKSTLIRNWIKEQHIKYEKNLNK